MQGKLLPLMASQGYQPDQAKHQDKYEEDEAPEEVDGECCDWEGELIRSVSLNGSIHTEFM